MRAFHRFYDGVQIIIMPHQYIGASFGRIHGEKMRRPLHWKVGSACIYPLVLLGFILFSTTYRAWILVWFEYGPLHSGFINPIIRPAQLRELWSLVI